jgi:signal transduction histidine kinase/ActR/RegA family two-component response regulator
MPVLQRLLLVLCTGILIIVSGMTTPAHPQSINPAASKSLPSQLSHLEKLEALSIKIEQATKTSTYGATEESVNNQSIPRILRLRTKISNAFDIRLQRDRGILIDEHQRLATDLQSPADLVLNQMYRELDTALSTANNSSEIELKNSILEKYIQSYLNSFKKNYSLALQQASEAFNVIPQNEEPEATYARILSYQSISLFHNLLGNTDLAMEVTEDFLDQAAVINFDVKGTELINNLMFGFGLSNDIAALNLLSDYLLRIENISPSPIMGLVEFRAANVYVETGKFEKALKVIKAGLEKTGDTVIRQYLDVLKVSALAGAGQTPKAKAKLADFEKKYPAESRQASAVRQLIYSKALIARAEGNAALTHKLMREYNDSKIQRIMDTNKNSSMSLLANLENNKQRQAERAAAAAEKNRLEQAALKHKIRNTNLALLIVGLLLVTALGLVTFFAYRARTTADLASAAEAALAGEKAKSQFLAVISHELRTPLNGIIGIADLLSRTAPTEILRGQIGIINRSGLDLLRLVEQILDMSRIDAKEMELLPEATDIRTVIANTQKLWEQKISSKEVTFTCYVHPDIPHSLMLDPMRLRQCLNNLLSNAAKFTQQGRIHLHVTSAPNGTGSGEIVTINVADTGMGIRPDIQAKLFKPFVQADSSITRQYGGSGLGLAITRNLAQMMGGDLTVNSRAGAGSEFTLTFTCEAAGDADVFGVVEAEFESLDKAAKNIAVSAPARMPPLSGSSPTSQKMPAQASLDGVRVLIVEDVISNQDVMKVFLEPEGCKIMCTANGYEALAALADQYFDVVLMDIRMPELDGIEATRLVRRSEGKNTHVPIIALTADATAETNAQCMAAGANIFLTKPVIAAELLDAIHFVLESAPISSQPAESPTEPRLQIA